MNFRMKNLLLCSLFLVTLQAMPSDQKFKIDSLEKLLPALKEPAARLLNINALARMWSNYDQEKCLFYLKMYEAESGPSRTPEQAATLHMIKGIYFKESFEIEKAVPHFDSAVVHLLTLPPGLELADCYSGLGQSHLGLHSYSLAILNFRKAIEIARLLKNKKFECENLAGIGSSYNMMGNKPKALEALQKSLDISKEINYNLITLQSLVFIGAVHLDGTHPENSLAYFEEALALAEKEKRRTTISAVKIYLGNAYQQLKDHEKALAYYKMVEEETRILGDSNNHAGTLGNIGNTLYDMGRKEEGYQYQLRALAMFERLQDRQGMTICYSAIGSILFDRGETDRSLEYYLKGLRIAKEIESWEDMIESYSGLAEVYERKGDFKNAFLNHKLYKQFNDSIFNKDNVKKLTELEMAHVYEEKQREQEMIQKSREELAAEQLKRQRIFSWGAAITGILAIIILAMVYRISAERKKTNIALLNSNTEITHQKDIIEVKNKEITDSINYAQRIQRALLNSESHIKKHVAEHFILSLPKDIVSGDFYWSVFSRNKLFVATCDCTGHGVPGAFMSMIGVSFLNELVVTNNMHDPGMILDKLRNEIIVALNPEGSDEERKDGMDMTLCVFDMEKKELNYAAANNPFWLIRDGLVTEHSADKQPVGKHLVDHKPFSTRTVPLNSGDQVYTFSDGFADQFGGPKGKKFKYKQLQKRILELRSETMDIQCIELEKSFHAWRTNLEQVDDVLMVGIKI